MTRTRTAALSVLALVAVASVPVAQAGFGGPEYDEGVQADEGDGPFAPRQCSTPRVKPTWIVLRCADSGILVNHLEWRSWGEGRAKGRGVLHLETCRPRCKGYPVKITLHKVRRKVCGVERLALFQRATLDFPRRDPNFARSTKKLVCE